MEVNFFHSTNSFRIKKNLELFSVFLMKIIVLEMSSSAHKFRQMDDVLNYTIRELDHLAKQETDLVENVFNNSGKNTRAELIIVPMQKEISKVWNSFVKKMESWEDADFNKDFLKMWLRTKNVCFERRISKVNLKNFSRKF